MQRGIHTVSSWEDEIGAKKPRERKVKGRYAELAADQLVPDMAGEGGGRHGDGGVGADSDWGQQLREDTSGAGGEPERSAVWTGAMKKQSRALLTQLLIHRWAHPFKVPITEQGFPAAFVKDYLAAIREPMDLGTVRNRFERGVYKGPFDFSRDVRLVFDNAMTYNREGTEIWKKAESIKRQFDTKMASIVKAGGRELPTPAQRGEKKSKRVPKKKEPHQVVPTPPRGANSDEPPPVSPKRKPGRPRVRPEADGVVPVGGKRKLEGGDKAARKRARLLGRKLSKGRKQRALSDEEKEKLAADLLALPEGKMQPVVEMVERYLPGPDDSTEEVELDIMKLDESTLWKLRHYVMNCKKGMHSRNREFTSPKQEEGEEGEGVPGTSGRGDVEMSEGGSASTAVRSESSDGGEEASLRGVGPGPDEDEEVGSGPSAFSPGKGKGRPRRFGGDNPGALVRQASLARQESLRKKGVELSDGDLVRTLSEDNELLDSLIDGAWLEGSHGGSDSDLTGGLNLDLEGLESMDLSSAKFVY